MNLKSGDFVEIINNDTPFNKKAYQVMELCDLGVTFKMAGNICLRKKYNEVKPVKDLRGYKKFTAPYFQDNRTK